MSNDIISRSALMEQLHNHYAVCNPVQNAIMDEVCMIVIRAPSVPAGHQYVPDSVIYCKDCDFCSVPDLQCHLYDDETEGMSHSTMPNGFCWLAKKRKSAFDAEWRTNSDYPDTIICSRCDSKFDIWKHEASDFRYCPHCGASMKMEAK